MTPPTDIVEALEKAAKEATPGPWKSRGLGGDSILLAPTHKWHKPYIQPEYGHPIAIPRVYQTRNDDGTWTSCTDYSSAGFAHEDAKFIAAANPSTVLALIAVVKAALPCVDELEAYIDDYYSGDKEYVSERRRYERDIAPVEKAREAYDSLASMGRE